VPKKTENKKAAAATASADNKKAAKLEIELISAPEPKPKAKIAPAKKTDAAPKPPAKTEKKPIKSAPGPAAAKSEAAQEPASLDPASLDPPAAPAKKKRAPAKTGATKTSKIKIKGATGAAAEVAVPVSAPVADPIGDVSDGEAYAVEGADVPSTPGESEALATALADEIQSNQEPDYIPQAAHPAGSAAPPAKLERLQKILAKAGIASRRHAEEMIVAGRVMVNGQAITQLGAKADPERDHIRVDGKLLSGAERHRYFVLNKPRGYVTTASDPEGRPTVMQFFEKVPLRLFPVGRLDYLSEGLLLVTNDGELANQLTRAAAGVEKTYLVKVAGKPTEQELEQLRSGVSIEAGKPGSKRVDTAPALVREIRQGDNPWFEVVLIEGRNRELRKMFEQIGHFVEKIRRVNYGPLVLDVEPGNFRELTPEEVKALQLTAEGKLKPRRPRAVPLVPRAEQPGRPPRRDAKPGFKPRFEGARPDRGSKPGFKRDSRPGFKPDFKPRFDNRSTEKFGGRSQFPPQFPRSEEEPRGESRPIEPQRGSSKPFRGRGDFGSARPQRFEQRNTGFRPQQRSQESDGEFAPRREFGPRGDKPQFNRGAKPEFKRNDRPAFKAGGKPDYKRADRPAFRPGGRPPFKRNEGTELKSGSRPAPDRGGQSTFKSERPAFERGSRPAFDRGSKPPFKPSDRPPFKRDDRPPFKRDDRPPFKPRGEGGGSFESRPSRPPGRTFGSRPAGKPAGRPSGAKFSGGSSTGRKFGSGAPRKSGSRPGGKVKPRWNR
jgi:23S rRNA pseudouridine2605 synthase